MFIFCYVIYVFVLSLLGYHYDAVLYVLCSQIGIVIVSLRPGSAKNVFFFHSLPSDTPVKFTTFSFISILR